MRYDAGRRPKQLPVHGWAYEAIGIVRELRRDYPGAYKICSNYTATFGRYAPQILSQRCVRKGTKGPGGFKNLTRTTAASDNQEPLNFGTC